MGTLYAAIILAGGSARRLGGQDKPAITVGGIPLVDRVRAACAHAARVVVVGPERQGGPVAALAAGLRLLDADGSAAPQPQAAAQAARQDPGHTAAAQAGTHPEGSGPGVGAVALLAADLPLLTTGALDALAGALPDHDGALYIDGQGRHQLLCGMWWIEVLRERLAGVDPDGMPLRRLVAGLRIAELADPAEPWFDCDTPEQLAEAERRLRA
ncbi:molybdenum cofactor guanylyltransferase [Longispora fulva]|uniref:Molybdopterin-guanine dinucleotide biosynthesis protein A n=1 Tax=Longispora fulva TaxID=619741 RepID=A0A8J7KIS2_9ACTN|nr:NTP transferase domain-containing protein [Longispora fulva]MBG6139575.1 molybdopterin-guanine dinucleotide biosynthesis protein A [Longispora fulva]GIG58042.1 molybdenum cofactor guanylyltransferase [Longispora fulva]